MFPIERPSKSGSIGGFRSEGGAFDRNKKKKEEKKERKFGWNYGVASKPKDEQQLQQSRKYGDTLSNIKNKASGINTRRYDSVVKPWDFNVVKGDASQAQYGSALSNLKNSIKGKN